MTDPTAKGYTADIVVETICEKCGRDMLTTDNVCSYGAYCETTADRKDREERISKLPAKPAPEHPLPFLAGEDRSHHFSTEAVLQAIGGESTDYVVLNLSKRLHFMTSGERYTLYRAVKKLVLEGQPPKVAPDSEDEAFERFCQTYEYESLVHGWHMSGKCLYDTTEFARSVWNARARMDAERGSKQ